VVDGALQACTADPDLQLLLVGPSPAADEVIAALDPRVRDRVSVQPVERGVAMSDPVADGADPGTSIGAAVLALVSGQADALVSAGFSGAIVAATVLGLGRLPGVRRPALTAVLPSLDGPLVLLDVGAGMQVNLVDMVQHAILGAGYARLAAGVEEPRVGLLSVGAEPGKGDRLRRAVDAALRTEPLVGARYVGPVEGNDVVTGTRADVVVTDGFTGNILLKGVEAAMSVAAGPRPATHFPRAAALLGVAGTVVVCHGAADGADIASGLALAARLVRLGVVAGLGALPALSPAAEPATEPEAVTVAADPGAARIAEGQP
jgi:glycerol-3-phosphate acyltransferase PlsX